MRLGHPEGMLETVKAKVGDAEVNRDAVAQALTSIGYKVADDNDASSADAEDSAQANEALAKVSSLSSEVSSAAQNPPADQAKRKISEAKTMDELIAATQEAGIDTSYT